MYKTSNMQMFFRDVISTLYCATGNIGNYVCDISLIQMTAAWMHSFFCKLFLEISKWRNASKYFYIDLNERCMGELLLRKRLGNI